MFTSCGRTLARNSRITKILVHRAVLFAQRSNLGAFSRAFSSSRIQNPDEIEINNYKDWLSPNEVIRIFQNLKNPSSALHVLTLISERKDYKPNEAIYSIVIKNLGISKNFDDIEILMEKIKNERKCRLSDDFFYNVIKIYAHLGGRINSAIDMLFDMPSYKCWPSVRTFNFVLNVLVNSKQFDVVDKVYTRGVYELGVEIDECCLNIIVKGLCRCGEFDAVYKVFDEFPKQNCRPNVRTFATVMHALCVRGRVDEALSLLERMEREGVEADAVVFNTLIFGLRKVGRVDEAIEMFKKVMVRGCDPNPGTYQEMLYALLDGKRFLEAKDFMSVMIDKRVNPSFESYKLMIHGLCDGKLLEDLDWVLMQMVRHGFVPRMGMWKKILGCLFPDGDCVTTCSYDEILAD
ncbi:pentatricopeptide repeat-containing protein, mitochondrial-like [Capsicum chacoense]